MESVVALFPSTQKAHTALRTLQERGFDRDHLAFALTDSVAENELAQQTGISPEAGAPSGSSNTVRGGILGLVAGLAITVPVWLLLMIVPDTRVYSDGGLVGMLFGAIAGIGLGGMFGALAGSDHGDYVKLLRRMGVPSAEAERFYYGMQNGNVMVIARDPSAARADEALNIMRHSGAIKLEDAVGGGQLQSERDFHH